MMEVVQMDTEEAVDRIVESLRTRLLEARRHGQTVRMSAKESGSITVSTREFERRPIGELASRIKPKRFELHIYIGDER